MNPSKYVIDLGIDANLGVESGSTYPLQQGLVEVTETNTGEGNPQWYTKLRRKHEVGFRLWDITGESSGNLQIISLTAYFLRPTDTSCLSSPLCADKKNPIVFSDKIYLVKSGVKSSVFKDPNDGWVVGADTALGESFTLEKKGRYLLRIEVVVVAPPMGRRTYVLDPEMIVGSSEGTPVSMGSSEAVPQAQAK